MSETERNKILERSGYAGGYVNQHIAYMPFGEDFVNQRTDRDIRFKFTGKEKDSDIKPIGADSLNTIENKQEVKQTGYSFSIELILMLGSPPILMMVQETYLVSKPPIYSKPVKKLNMIMSITD
jgi:hypothetical protein